MANIDYPSKAPARIAIAFGVIAIVLSLLSFTRSNAVNDNANSGTKETALERIKKTGVLHVAYGGFPPYTIIDLDKNSDSDQFVSGICVDIMKEIASRHNPKLKLVWHNLNWETLRTDMMSKNFDLLADALYQTIPLASDFSLSDPFSYFGIGCALVKKDDNRFKDFEDLDRSDITIAVAVGWLSTDYAKANLEKPTFKEILVSESPFTQLDEVLHGRADVAIQDVPTVLAYAKAHKDKVKALWISNPPATVAGGFAARREDQDLIDFINVSLMVLKLDGTLDKIDKKWSGMGYYEKVEFTPGQGLVED